MREIAEAYGRLVITCVTVMLLVSILYRTGKNEVIDKSKDIIGENYAGSDTGESSIVRNNSKKLMSEVKKKKRSIHMQGCMETGKEYEFCQIAECYDSDEKVTGGRVISAELVGGEYCGSIEGSDGKIIFPFSGIYRLCLSVNFQDEKNVIYSVYAVSEDGM